MSGAVTSSKLRKLCKKIEGSGKLPEFRAVEDLLVRVPITDYLVRCVCLYRSLYLPERLEVRAVFLPLYAYQEFFSLHYSKEIRPVSGAWQLGDEEQLIAKISEDASKFLDQARTALEFTRLAPKICDWHSEQTDEEIATSFAVAGNLVRARLQLELLNAMYYLHKDNKGTARIARVLNALRNGADVKSVIKEQVRESMSAMRLEQLEDFFA